MLPIARKSVEPLAAHIDPMHVRANISRCITCRQIDMSDSAPRSVVRGAASIDRADRELLDYRRHRLPQKGKHSSGGTVNIAVNLASRTIARSRSACRLPRLGSFPSLTNFIFPRTGQVTQKNVVARRGFPRIKCLQPKPEIALEQLASRHQVGVPPACVGGCRLW